MAMKAQENVLAIEGSARVIARQDGRLRRILVEEGKLGERTLLIDADLRAPRQHRIFNVPDRIGLSAVLSGRADRGAVVPILECGTLSLLPAGACPPNPQELLLRPAFATLLEELRAEF